MILRFALGLVMVVQGFVLQACPDLPYALISGEACSIRDLDAPCVPVLSVFRRDAPFKVQCNYGGCSGSGEIFVPDTSAVFHGSEGKPLPWALRDGSVMKPRDE